MTTSVILSFITARWVTYLLLLMFMYLFKYFLVVLKELSGNISVICWIVFIHILIWSNIIIIKDGFPITSKVKILFTLLLSLGTLLLLLLKELWFKFLYWKSMPRFILWKPIKTNDRILILLLFRIKIKTLVPKMMFCKLMQTFKIFLDFLILFILNCLF